MIEYVASQSVWFVPQLMQLLHSPAAAFLPAIPAVSYISTASASRDEEPPWAAHWARSDQRRQMSAEVVATVAITEEEHRQASALVRDRYCWRGYGDVAEGRAKCKQRELTLLAWSDSEVVGTMTMGFDDGEGLLADQAHADRLDAIRARGRTICEFTRFAVASWADSKATISGLFDLSYVLGRKMLGVSDVVVEVNPRHAGFYRRAFGFQPISEVRTCGRVNAPAVLMWLDVAEMEERMRDVGADTPGDLALART